MAGPCGRGKIARPALSKLVGEDGEGNGLLGVGIDAVYLGCIHGKLRHQFRKTMHDPAIVDSSARHDDFANTVLFRHCAPDGLGDGLHRELRCRGDQVHDSWRPVARSSQRRRSAPAEIVRVPAVFGGSNAK